MRQVSIVLRHRKHRAFINPVLYRHDASTQDTKSLVTLGSADVLCESPTRAVVNFAVVGSIVPFAINVRQQHYSTNLLIYLLLPSAYMVHWLYCDFIYGMFL